MSKTSYCSYAWPAQPGPIRWQGSLRSDSVIKLVSVLFSKCITLVATKCWPMKTRLPCGDQWKAEKQVFWRWPITKCFTKSDTAGLIIEHSINFRLNGEHWRAVQFARELTSVAKQATSKKDHIPIEEGFGKPELLIKSVLIPWFLGLLYRWFHLWYIFLCIRFQ